MTKIDIPIYDQFLYVTLDKSEFMRFWEAQGGDVYEISDRSAGHFNVYDSIFCLWLSPDVLHHYVVHEAGHITLTLCEHIGIDISDQESFCYLLSFIYKELISFVYITTNTPIESESV